MYKVANGIVPEQTQVMFNKSTNIDSHNTRSASSGKYVILKVKPAIGQTAFLFYIKQAQSIHRFQEKLKEYLIQQNT